MKPYRRRLTISEKRVILKEAELIGIPAAAHKYNLNPITIRKWKKPERVKKERIRNKERNKVYLQNWRKDHPEYFNENFRRQRKNNIEKFRQKGRESIKRQYALRKPEIDELRRKRNKVRYREDAQYRILCCLRSRVLAALKGKIKFKTTLELLGCSIEVFRKHIEKQFKSGMTWENHGDWHIDHIKPCTAFDLSKKEEQQKCFHYTNCQPLWKIDNIKKWGHRNDCH